MNTARYSVVRDWAKLPEGFEFKQVAGIVIDSSDRVYVFCRGQHPVIVFDKDGNMLQFWGEGMFTTPHGICLESDKYLYLADSGDHTVRKFTLSGELVMILGTEGVPGDGGKPFKGPTDVAVSPSGEIFVSDGYGNRRIHKFDERGNLILSWGEEGSGHGQFALPHGIFFYNDRVYVADRENHRIQIFDTNGNFIEQWKSDFNMPCDVFIDSDGFAYIPELRHRLSIVDMKGNLVLRMGGQESREPGSFVAPHTACVDSEGNLYIGEVLEGQRIQKFKRISC